MNNISLGKWKCESPFRPISQSHNRTTYEMAFHSHMLTVHNMKWKGKKRFPVNIKSNFPSCPLPFRLLVRQRENHNGIKSSWMKAENFIKSEKFPIYIQTVMCIII